MKQILFAVLALAMATVSAIAQTSTNTVTTTSFSSSWETFDECNTAFNLKQYVVYEPLDFSGVSKHPITKHMRETQLEDNYCADTSIVGGTRFVIMPRGSKAICMVNKDGSTGDCIMRADCRNTIYRMFRIQPTDPPAQVATPAPQPQPQKQIVVPAGSGAVIINIYNNVGGGPDTTGSRENGGGSEQQTGYGYDAPAQYGIASYSYVPQYYVSPIIWWGGSYWGWGSGGYYQNWGSAYNYAWHSGGPGYGYRGGNYGYGNRGDYGNGNFGNRGGNYGNRGGQRGGYPPGGHTGGSYPGGGWHGGGSSSGGGYRSGGNTFGGGGNRGGGGHSGGGHR